MTETVPQPEASFLPYVRQTNIERLVSHLGGVGDTIKRRYPQPEIDSWPIQKPEAEALLALVNPDLATAAATAPYLLQVTEHHFGPAADDAERLQQLLAKAASVKANADAWAAIGAYVNGLRARAQDAIEAAETEAEAHEAMHEAFTELSVWRSQAGV